VNPDENTPRPEQSVQLDGFDLHIDEAPLLGAAHSPEPDLSTPWSIIGTCWPLNAQ
jgi:hypothetical protein